MDLTRDEQTQPPTDTSTPALITSSVSPTSKSRESSSGNLPGSRHHHGTASRFTPAELFRLYLKYLDRHPVATKAVTRC